MFVWREANMGDYAELDREPKSGQSRKRQAGFARLGALAALSVLVFVILVGSFAALTNEAASAGWMNWYSGVWRLKEPAEGGYAFASSRISIPDIAVRVHLKTAAP